MRKYWNPAVADLLNSQMAENGANRDRFQRYILDLAADARAGVRRDGSRSAALPRHPGQAA